MRTPKGMIRAFLTPEELNHLIDDRQAKIDEINAAMDSQNETIKEALRAARDQISLRKAQLDAMRVTTPRKPGRPRKASNGEPKNRVEASTEATA